MWCFCGCFYFIFFTFHVFSFRWFFSTLMTLGWLVGGRIWDTGIGGWVSVGFQKGLRIWMMIDVWDADFRLLWGWVWEGWIRWGKE
jgi:hypothetical protein